MYFGVVVLVIVNGQPTTDDDIDKQEIAQLREELAKVRDELASMKDEHVKSVARISNLEDQLAAAVDKTDRPTQRDASKLNTVASSVSLCTFCLLK